VSRFLPRLESLEDRTVPSTLTPGPLVVVSVPDPLAGCQHLTEWQHGTRDTELEPLLSVNPTNPKNIVAIWIAHDFSGTVASVTLDGGTTWQNVAIPGISRCTGGTADNGADPWLAFAPDGVLYAESFSGGTIDMSRSLDGGLTWGGPITVSDPSEDADRGSVTADPGNSNLVYAAWNVGIFGGTPAVKFARSTDGGQIWEPNRAIYTAPAGNLVWNAKVEPLPDGSLVCLFTELVLTGYAKKVPQYNFALSVTRSTDKGQTWSAPTKVLTQMPRGDPNPQDQVWWAGVTDPDNGNGIEAVGAFHSTAVDPRNGNLYAVWTDARFSGGRYDGIAFSRSTDGGVTWSAPIQVNQTPANIPAPDRQAWYPTVAVAADGTIGVCYYDLRFNDAGKGCLTDYWLVQCPASKASTEPASWANETRLTGASFDIEQAATWNLGGAYAYFLGDYQGLAPVGNGFAAVWAQPYGGSPDHILFRSLNASPMASQSDAGLGGGLPNTPGAALTASNSTRTGNQAVGGAGGTGGRFGGGAFYYGLSISPANFGTPATAAPTGSTIGGNQATGGAAGAGGTAGLGEGGGAYFASGGIVCLDAFTQAHLTNNHASTGDDDLFGTFTTCP
jgi:hypothetical protein